MKKIFYLLGFWLLLPLLGGCGDSVDEPLPEPEPTPEPEPEPTPDPVSGSRTVLIYIVAENNLSHFATDDLEEMMQGVTQIDTDIYNLLVYIDDYSETLLLRLRNEEGRAVCDTLQDYGAQVSTSPEVMTAVLQDAYGSYPADSYGLIYWSHADGWISYGSTRATTRWVGQDTGSGDRRMNIDELCEVLDAAPHLDFLMFDACFMQSVEVAYELRAYTDYYIGSPTENPGPGAPYDVILPMMFDENAAEAVAAAYFEHYENKYQDGSGLTNDNWTAGTAIGVIKTAALDRLAQATRQLLPEASEDFNRIRGEVFDYDRRTSSSHVGYYDMYELMEVLAVDAAALAEWEQAFEAAVVYWATTPRVYSQFGGMFSMERARGLTHYIPSTLGGTALADYRTLAWYNDAGLSQLGW